MKPDIGEPSGLVQPRHGQDQAAEVQVLPVVGANLDQVIAERDARHHRCCSGCCFLDEFVLNDPNSLQLINEEKSNGPIND